MCSTTSDAWTLPTAGWAQKVPWASEETPAPAGTWTAALDYPEETLAHRNCEIIKVFKPLNWCQFVAQQSTTLQINALITTDTQELWAFWFLMGEFTKAMTWTKVLWDKWGQTQSLNRSKMDENIKGSFSTRLNNHAKSGRRVAWRCDLQTVSFTGLRICLGKDPTLQMYDYLHLSSAWLDRWLWH